MSISDLSGEKVDPARDKFALGLRDDLGSLDVAGMRLFAITLMRGCGVPMARIAEAFRCSVATARRDGRLPPEGQERKTGG